MAVHVNRRNLMVNLEKTNSELLNRIPETAIERCLTLLNLHDSWEWATREERKMLVRTVIQETWCNVGANRIVWVMGNPDYEILFRLMNGLHPDAGRTLLDQRTYSRSRHW